MLFRPTYLEGQYLSHQDLNAEQAYHLDQRRRHNIVHHTWGIVTGLALEEAEDGEGVWVNPGIAVDGYGRELIVPERILIERAWNGNGEIYLYLCYERDTLTGVDGAEAGKVREDRWCETVSIGWTKEKLNLGKSALDTSDDPTDEWPVLLGVVKGGTCEPDADASKEHVRYVDAVAEQIVTPDNTARLQLTAKHTLDKRRFAIQLAKDRNELGEPNWVDHLVIDRDNNLQINDDLTFMAPGKSQAATVTVAGRLVWAGAEKEPKEPVARPWQIYQVELADGRRELRIELPSLDDERSNYANDKFVIGYDRLGGFQPVLSVSAEGQVEMQSKLTLDGGRLIEDPIEPDPEDPDFVKEIARALIDGGYKFWEVLESQDSSDQSG